jgi:1-acyl-sn-glycerol-3-phosphate acyltransferase
LISFIHFFLFVPVLIVDTVIFSFLAILGGIFNPYSLYNSIVIRTWARIILWMAGVRLEVEGLVNIGKKISYIIIANHQSYMDIPVLIVAMKLSIRIIAKRELFKIPIFGWGMRAGGIIEIDRSNQKKSIETLQKVEEIIRSNNISILAFPEGTRSDDGKIGSFKRGPVILAINTGLPILPVSVSGTRRILPKGKIRISHGKVKVVIHQPIETKNLSLQNRHELAEQVQKTITEGFIEDY